MTSIPLPIELATYAVLGWLAIATDLLTTQVVWHRLAAAARWVRHMVVCRWRATELRMVNEPHCGRMRCARCGWVSAGWQKVTR